MVYNIDLSIAEAAKRGARAGHNAATWYFDGNTTDATYRDVARMIADGAPESDLLAFAVAVIHHVRDASGAVSASLEELIRRGNELEAAEDRAEYVPIGRLPELRARPEADRIAYTMPERIFGDARVTTYASRSAMLAFCKGRHHALVKEPTDPNMIVNPNTQTPR